MDEDLIFLKEADPLPDLDVQSRADALARGVAGSLTVDGRRSSSRYVLAGATLALVAILVAVAVLARSDGQVGNSTLLRIASTVPVEEGPGDSGMKYRYTLARAKRNEIRVISASESVAIQVSVERQTWLDSNGTGVVRERITGTDFLADEDETRWLEAGTPVPSGEIERPITDGFSASKALDLPVDNLDALTEMLASDGDAATQPSNERAFSAAIDLLRESQLPSDLRAQLLRVLARLPGVVVDAGALDSLGRPGVAISMTSANSGALTRDTAVLDPAKGTLLSENVVALEPLQFSAAVPPFELSSVAYVLSEPRDTIG